MIFQDQLFKYSLLPVKYMDFTLFFQVDEG